MTVPGSWLCPKGYALRDIWNALQKANGTSALRMIPPSAEERIAAREYDEHLQRCSICGRKDD